MEKRIVKLVVGEGNTNRKYKLHPYRSIAIWSDTLKTYLTGQHIDHYKDTTRNNLTTDEMTGKERLSPQKAKLFPYVINPLEPLMLIHNAPVDLTKDELGNYINVVDKAFYDYLVYQPVVALNKEVFNRTKHVFYIQDEEKEAAGRITQKSLVYKAAFMIRENTSFEKLKEVGLLLNFSSTDFNVNLDRISKVKLEDMIYSLCEKDPQKVIDCFDADVDNKLFVLKLVDKGILKRKGNDFFEGSRYIANGLDGVLAYISNKEGQLDASKWHKMFDNKYEQTRDVTYTALEDIFMLSQKGFMCLLDNDLAGAEHILTQMEGLDPKGDKVALLRLQIRKYKETTRDNDEIHRPRKVIQDPLDSIAGKAIQDEDIQRKEMREERALRIKCGRAKLPREEWVTLTLLELREYVKRKII